MAREQVKIAAYFVAIALINNCYAFPQFGKFFLKTIIRSNDESTKIENNSDEKYLLAIE